MKFKYEVGQRVNRGIDIYSPEKGLKHGIITRCYSKPAYKIGDIHLGPYPELYEVLWDDGTKEEGFFWFGISKEDVS